MPKNNDKKSNKDELSPYLRGVREVSDALMFPAGYAAREAMKKYEANKPKEYLSNHQIQDRQDKAEVQKGLKDDYEQRRAKEISKTHMDMDKKLNDQR